MSEHPHRFRAVKRARSAARPYWDGGILALCDVAPLRRVMRHFRKSRDWPLSCVEPPMNIASFPLLPNYRPLTTPWLRFRCAARVPRGRTLAPECEPHCLPGCRPTVHDDRPHACTGSHRAPGAAPGRLCCCLWWRLALARRSPAGVLDSGLPSGPCSRSVQVAARIVADAAAGGQGEPTLCPSRSRATSAGCVSPRPTTWPGRPRPAPTAGPRSSCHRWSLASR